MKFTLNTFFLFIAFITNAQYHVDGRVIDSITEKPLVGVNIFLSHTTFGTSSNEKGEFQLQNLKQGKYELVVSSLNYEDYIIPISTSQITTSLLIKSKPSANILKEVVVESYDPRGWNNWGDAFRQNFIGATQLARNCNLLNPDAVKFKFNPKTNKLRVFSNEKLIFENRALGYKIYYLLTKFELDYNNKSFSFKGYPLFEELKTIRPKEANKWIQARNETFKGSIRHFIRSLYADQLEQDGFELREVRTVNSDEKKRATELLRQIQEKADKGDSSVLKVDRDSLDYYIKANALSYGETKVTLNKLILRDDIIFNTNNTIDPTSRSVYFEGMLQVIYNKKKMPYEYIRTVPSFATNDNIRTDIFLRTNKSILIYQNGTYYSGLDLFTDGYWSWSEKVATMMPSDYVLQTK
jgi:CarboxypepD_reg-like domain